MVCEVYKYFKCKSQQADGTMHNTGNNADRCQE